MLDLVVKFADLSAHAIFKTKERVNLGSSTCIFFFLLYKPKEGSASTATREKEMEETQFELEEVGPSSTSPRAVPARSMPPTSMPHLPTCVCGMKTVMITSWTAQNPGRRFAKCALGEVCNIFLDT